MIKAGTHPYSKKIHKFVTYNCKKNVLQILLYNFANKKIVCILFSWGRAEGEVGLSGNCASAAWRHQKKLECWESREGMRFVAWLKSTGRRDGHP